MAVTGHLQCMSPTVLNRLVLLYSTGRTERVMYIRTSRRADALLCIHFLLSCFCIQPVWLNSHQDSNDTLSHRMGKSHDMLCLAYRAMPR